MQLGFQQHLIDPKSRDLSDKVGWELLRLDREVEPDEEDTTQVPPGQISTVAGEAGQRSRLYPNPAIYTTTLEIAPLSPGLYSIEIVAVDGRRLGINEIRVEEAGELFEILNLSSLSSGHYIVRVTTASSSIGEYPIVVVR
jgi:hypothetical protein